MNMDTIAAVATPIGNGGIGIIRISGPLSISIVAAIFKLPVRNDNPGPSPSGKNQACIQNRGMYYGHIVDPDSNRLVDEVLLLVMPGPRSYTTEDVVEIHAHGGRAVLNAILELVFKQGAKPAVPGEFTKRAFLNGRIDLTQAEAVADLINAGSPFSMHLAANQIKGILKSRVEDILGTIREVLTEAEAAIDFPEEVVDIFDKEVMSFKLDQDVIDPLSTLAEHFFQAEALRNGIKVAIIGKPNVGKSSLMNCLLKKDRAIVSDLPGTTRDLIEESRLVNNIQILFGDTAGLHDTEHAVEKIGIRKTHEYISEADMVLIVLDVTRPIDNHDIDLVLSLRAKKRVIVLNKKDLIDSDQAHKMKLPDTWNDISRVATSAKQNDGIDLLQKIIFDNAVEIHSSEFEEIGISLNQRHYFAVKAALESIKSARQAINDGISPEFCVIDLKAGIQSLEGILGIAISLDVLDAIFDRFCIGK